MITKNSTTKIRPLSKSEEIALYYGFRPIEELCISRKDSAAGRYLRARVTIDKPFLCDPVEKAALLRTYEENNFREWPHPLQVYHSKTGDPKSNIVGLDIFGSGSSAANALLVRSAVSMLEESGKDDLFIEINSIGDKISFAEFERQINTYVRKHINDIPASIQRLLRQNPFYILNSEDQKIKDFAENAPKPIGFLSDSSRVYLKEVIEYLEGFGIPYMIKHSLTGNPAICSGVVFRIKSENSKDNETLALGFSYSKFAKKIGLRRDLPAIGVTIHMNSEPKSKSVLPKIKFSLIQLGFEAKLKTLNVIETLRRAQVPVLFSLMKDKITNQLTEAEESNVPFVIIIGQKEALEDTVVVRDMNTRVQQIIPISELTSYIRSLRV
jgi:histidyl-tRNA synthetase